MNFEFGEKEEKLRMEIREFVKENLPPGHVSLMFDEEHSDENWEFSMSMAKKLSEKGWLTLAWPKEYGGMGASVSERVVFGEEAGYWGIPGTSMGVSGTNWVGPSLMLFGTEEQKKKYLPLIASADPDGVWCTGYSEPDSGSDFASLKTQAEKKGDEYIINGQKVWTSAAHYSRWCWLAVKTDPNVKKKHHGISIIIVDMKSPGVTVRPIPLYTGRRYFNEVFFSNVKVPVENLVGKENNGWYQLMTALAFERGVAVGCIGLTRRILDELTEFTKETGLIHKTEVRRKLAEMAVDIESLKILAYEAAWKASIGKTVIYEPSRDKAYNDMLLEKISRLGTEIIGAYSQIDILSPDSKWSKVKGMIENLYFGSPGMAIAAGTTDTMKNIVGQFGLKLPKSY